MTKREFNDVDIRVVFNETTNRQQISSGDNINTLFGKIRKWFSDLKPVAFSGRYSDLQDKPTALPADGGISNTISEVLPISKGGTGKTTAQEGYDTLVNGLAIGGDAAVITDDDYFVSQYLNGNDPSVNQNSYRRRKMIVLWNYIKNKCTSIFTKKETVDVIAVSSSDLKSNFRELIQGKTGTGNFLKAVRNNTSSPNVNNAYDTGIAFGAHDTHGWMCMKYGSADVFVGGGNGNSLKWTEKMAFKSDINTISTEVSNLKKYVSDGKAAVAGSITGKGVTTAADATFAIMAENIRKIPTGSDVLPWQNTSNGTYKFAQSGSRWIANNRGINSSTATSTWKVTVPAGTTAYIAYRTTTETADKLSIVLNGTTVLSAAGGLKSSETLITLNLIAGENTLTATYVKDGSLHSYGDMAYVILPPVGEQPGQYRYQSKSVTPSSASQTVYPDTGYDGFYSVTVSAATSNVDIYNKEIKIGCNSNIPIFRANFKVKKNSTYTQVYYQLSKDNGATWESRVTNNTEKSYSASDGYTTLKCGTTNSGIQGTTSITYLK